MADLDDKQLTRKGSGTGSLVKAWLLAIIALGGCGALGFYYWKLHDAHKQQTGELAEARKLADDQPAQKSRADKAEGELAKAKEDNATLTADKEKLEKANEFTAKELGTLREMKRQADEREAEFEKFKNSFKEMIDSKVLEVESREGRLVVRMAAEVLFPLGSAELSEKGQIELYKLSAILQKEQVEGLKEDAGKGPRRKLKFMIAGHTDNGQMTAGSKYKDNWELSTARAVTVTELLVKAGIDPKSLVAAGYGEFSPIADNHTEKGRARNRRIEIVLLPDVDELTSLADDAGKGDAKKDDK